MAKFEYKVVPAPVKAVRVKGAKSVQARFAHALSQLMNELGAEGWEYLRADALPCEERQGLTGKTTKFQNMLIFRRALSERADDFAHTLQSDADPDPNRIAATLASSDATDDLPELRIDAAEPNPPQLGPAPGRTRNVAAE